MLGSSPFFYKTHIFIQWLQKVIDTTAVLATLADNAATRTKEHKAQGPKGAKETHQLLQGGETL